MRITVFDGLLTMIRVLVLIALASLVWVPIGVWIGLRPRLGHEPAAGRAVPGGLPGERAVPRRRALAIVRWRLDPNVWLSPLMILGTQWYILFNVIAGASAIPTDLRDVGRQLFRLRLAGSWWRKVAAAGDPALLRDRRAHGRRRLVERQHRRRGT